MAWVWLFFFACVCMYCVHRVDFCFYWGQRSLGLAYTDVSWHQPSNWPVICYSAYFLWNTREIGLPTDKKHSKKPLNQKGQKEGLWSPRNNLPFLQHTVYECFMLTARACSFVADSVFVYHNKTYFPLCSLWRRNEIPFLSTGQLKALSPAWTAQCKDDRVEECPSSQQMASGHKGTLESLAGSYSAAFPLPCLDTHIRKM